MKQTKFFWWNPCICLVFLLSYSTSFGQTNSIEERKRQRIGLNYGLGTQQSFPFSSDAYTYDVSYVKFNYLKIFTRGEKLNFGFSIEPGLYQSRVNDFSDESTLPLQSEDNGALIQNQSTQTNNPGYVPNRMTEYVLNIGVHMFYRIQRKIDGYLLGSIGPMILDTETSIQKKGFAFSDIVAVGMLYHIKSIVFDLRFGVRHVSNAGFGRPNVGYNSTNLEMGFSIPLDANTKKPIVIAAAQNNGYNYSWGH